MKPNRSSEDTVSPAANEDDREPKWRNGSNYSLTPHWKRLCLWLKELCDKLSAVPWLRVCRQLKRTRSWRWWRAGWSRPRSTAPLRTSCSSTCWRRKLRSTRSWTPCWAAPCKVAGPERWTRVRDRLFGHLLFNRVATFYFTGFTPLKEFKEML